jgi:uncharacterized membrane protein
MNQKTIAWVSYITLIGWIIALISYNSSPDKSSLARFHIKQSLGLMLTAVAISFLSILLGAFGLIFNLLNLGVLVLWVIGLVAAVNSEEKPVPFIGDFYQKTLTFIN